ncbi:MAG: hypothetical protein ACYC7E_09130 [Armatimonadota bacterium]
MPDATPMLGDIVSGTDKVNTLMYKFDTDIEARHNKGAVIGFVDGHINYESFVTSTSYTVTLMSRGYDLFPIAKAVSTEAGPFWVRHMTASQYERSDPFITMPPEVLKSGTTVPDVRIEFDMANTANYLGIYNPWYLTMYEVGTNPVSGAMGSGSYDPNVMPVTNCIAAGISNYIGGVGTSLYACSATRATYLVGSWAPATVTAWTTPPTFSSGYYHLTVTVIGGSLTTLMVSTPAGTAYGSVASTNNVSAAMSNNKMAFYISGNGAAGNNQWIVARNIKFSIIP